MYFYVISSGSYSDYSYSMIYHEKKFTNKEFAEMYNKSLEELGGKYDFDEGIAEKMVELFGFKLVEKEFEINADFYSHRLIDLNKVPDDERLILIDEL